MPVIKYLTSLLILLLITFGCKNNNKSIDICSYQIESLNEKVQIFKRYIDNNSEIIDLEYCIKYHDNGFAPDDYTILIAVQTQSNFIENWTKDLNYIDGKEIDLAVIEKLELNNEQWDVSSKYQVYSDEMNKVVKLVFSTENIIVGLYSSSESWF